MVEGTEGGGLSSCQPVTSGRLNVEDEKSLTGESQIESADIKEHVGGY